MTAVALLPERPPMKIVIFMTVNTSTACIAEFFVRLVTGAALLFGVLTLQREAGLIVIKCIQLQIDDVRVPPPVISVASRTLTGARHGVQTMESARTLAICLNLFMAVQTQTGRSGLVEGFMALGTFGFKLGMPADQLAGHKDTMLQRQGFRRSRRQGKEA